MKAKAKKALLKEIIDYDTFETLPFIDQKKKLRFKEIGLELPKQPPTQVISIRLPTELVNEIKAFGSQLDIPYQALIKLFLAESVKLRRG